MAINNIEKSTVKSGRQNRAKSTVESAREELRNIYKKEEILMSQTGIFTQQQREKILTNPWDKTTSDFRYDVRKRMKASLLDLQLYIELASKKDVNKVVTREALKSVIEALLWTPVVEQAKPDLVRAEIAQLFIRAGFDYLTSMKPSYMTSSHKNTMENAFDLADFLVELFKPESERRYMTPSRPIDRLR
jgi:hypothetical protein